MPRSNSYQVDDLLDLIIAGLKPDEEWVRRQEAIQILQIRGDVFTSLVYAGVLPASHSKGKGSWYWWPVSYLRALKLFVEQSGVGSMGVDIARLHVVQYAYDRAETDQVRAQIQGLCDRLVGDGTFMSLREIVALTKVSPDAIFMHRRQGRLIRVKIDNQSYYLAICVRRWMTSRNRRAKKQHWFNEDFQWLSIILECGTAPVEFVGVRQARSLLRVSGEKFNRLLAQGLLPYYEVAKFTTTRPRVEKSGSRKLFPRAYLEGALGYNEGKPISEESLSSYYADCRAWRQILTKPTLKVTPDTVVHWLRQKLAYERQDQGNGFPLRTADLNQIQNLIDTFIFNEGFGWLLKILEPPGSATEYVSTEVAQTILALNTRARGDAILKELGDEGLVPYVLRVSQTGAQLRRLYPRAYLEGAAKYMRGFPGEQFKSLPSQKKMLKLYRSHCEARNRVA